MKRNAFTFWQAVLILVFLMIVAAVLFPIFGRKRGMEHPVSCQMNLKQIALGIKQYVQDYDGKFPLVDSGKQGWMDIIQPYLKSTKIFQCPNETSERVDGTTDYFYNARLASQDEGKLSYMSSIIMLGDGLGESPSNVSLSKLPLGWAINQNSPAWRHKQGANYAYADGHTKWLRSTSVTDKKSAPNISTFALR